jgi:hypothetical protein
MLVVSDGDIARNLYNPQTGQTFPLGKNPFEGYTFANKDFLLNAVEYLRDDQGIIEARGREVKLRLLDTARAGAEQSFWQLLNILVPLVLLVAFGLLFNYIRKNRFVKN